jgi:PhnB protein
MRMTHTQVTVTAIQPRLVLSRVDEAVVFYEACFGAKLIEHFVDPNGVVIHAAMLIGASIVTMTEEVSSWELLAPPSIGGSPVLLHLTVPDPDATCTRMTERGAHVVVSIEDRPWGRREGRVRDPWGHLWILSRPTDAAILPRHETRASR